MKIDESIAELIIRTVDVLDKLSTPELNDFTISYAWNTLLWPIFFSAAYPISDEEVFWLLKELDDLGTFEYSRIKGLHKDYESFDKLDKLIFDSIMDIHLKYRDQETFKKENEVLRKYIKVPIRNNIIQSILTALKFFITYMEHNLPEIYEILLTNPERVVITIGKETQYEEHKTDKIHGLSFTLAWLWLHEMGFAFNFTTATTNTLLLLEKCFPKKKFTEMYQDIQTDFELYLSVNKKVMNVLDAIASKSSKEIYPIHFDYAAYYFGKIKKRINEIDNFVAERITPQTIIRFLDENDMPLKILDEQLKDLYASDEIITRIYKFIKKS